MICDHCRNKAELFFIYTHIKMPNQYDWDFLCNNPNLFCFYDENNGKLRGYITVQREELTSTLPYPNGEGKKVLTLSGASVRKNMTDNINAIVKVCEAFNEDMYSVTRVKAAKICLLRAGFKKISNNIFVRYKNG